MSDANSKNYFPWVNMTLGRMRMMARTSLFFSLFSFFLLFRTSLFFPQLKTMGSELAVHA